MEKQATEKLREKGYKAAYKQNSLLYMRYLRLNIEYLKEELTRRTLTVKKFKNSKNIQK